MILRFDGNSHVFAEPESASAPIAAHVENLLDEVVVSGDHAENHSYNTNWGFNDLGYYMNLCAQDGCAKVELCAMYIQHNNFCMGVQAQYRSTFSNGVIRESSAPPHFYNRGFYSYNGGHYQYSRLELEGGEYLADIRTREGEITDQITLITNRRAVSFGGNGGVAKDAHVSVNLYRRIIAFAGTSKGVLERLGAISVSRNWDVVGPIVLLRTLVDQRRASLTQRDDAMLTKDGAVLQSLLVDVSEDVFRRISSFLAPGISVSD